MIAPSIYHDLTKYLPARIGTPTKNQAVNDLSNPNNCNKGYCKHGQKNHGITKNTDAAAHRSLK